MPFTSLPVAAETLKDGLTPDGIEGRVNAALSTVLDKAVVGVHAQIEDHQRRQGKVISVALAVDTAVSATVLTDPYQLITFTSQTLAGASAQASAWRALNPGWFYAPPLFWYVAQFAPAANEPHVVFQFYCEDANGADNWQVGGSGGGGGGGVLAGDVTGPSGANTVVAIRGKATPAPLVSGTRLVYDLASDTLVWYSTPTYASLAAAAADQANQVIGERIIVYNATATADDGTYQLTVKTGAPGDYTKISDATDTAAEVGIADAGGYYPTCSTVECALQSIGAGTSGVLSIGLVATVATSVAAAFADDYRQVVWALELHDPTTGTAERWSVEAQHNGTAAADATAVDYTISGLGPVTGNIPTIEVDLSGAGAAQVMRLRVTATPANWVARIKTMVATTAT